MWKLILLICFSAVTVPGQLFSQDNLIGRTEEIVNENGVMQKKIILTPERNPANPTTSPVTNFNYPDNAFNNTNVRWSYTEPTAIGDYCYVSGNGKYNVTGWNLNSERVSLYGNTNFVPIWEFPTDPNVSVNFVTISDTGGVIGVGSYHNVYLFNNTSNVPFFNYDLTRLPDTGIASSLDITNDGRFIVCSASRQDSSTVFGFNSTAADPTWSRRIRPTITTGGGTIQGIRISGNDSLVIVNTYAEFFVFRTYTGQLLFQGMINPTSPNSGTQAAQGISGNGNIIATINYSGIIRVYQWNGTTYNFLWQNQEPPGMFFNWYTGVDITFDGQYVAAGTLNFLTTSSFDGKIKVFRTTNSGTPLWTYQGCGDEVSAVSFSRSGNILAASSWGDLGHSTDDIYIFKTFLGNIPIFKVNTPGSLFYCNTSKDGRTVVTSGKAVHARQFGNGGLLLNIDVDTNDVPTSVIQHPSGVISEYKLHQNYPNPFNPVTKITFDIPQNVNKQSANVKLIIYNSSGKEVQTLLNEELVSGSYSVIFDGMNLSSGVYFYKLIAGDYSDSKKLLLIK